MTIPNFIPLSLGETDISCGVAARLSDRQTQHSFQPAKGGLENDETGETFPALAIAFVSYDIFS